MTKTASVDSDKNCKYTFLMCFDTQKNPTKHRRHECLKQFPLKPPLTLQSTSAYALFVACFKPVTFPDKLQWGGKAKPPAESLKEFCRSHSRFWERAEVEQYVQYIWLFSFSVWVDSNKSGNTGVNLYLPWPWAYNSDLWTGSTSNIWLTSTIEKGELISQPFIMLLIL